MLVGFFLGAALGGLFMMALTIWATSFQGLSRDEEFIDILKDLDILQVALKNIERNPNGPTARLAAEALRKAKTSKAGGDYEEMLKKQSSIFPERGNTSPLPDRPAPVRLGSDVA